jgi:hypothetical protein
LNKEESTAVRQRLKGAVTFNKNKNKTQLDQIKPNCIRCSVCYCAVSRFNSEHEMETWIFTWNTYVSNRWKQSICTAYIFEQNDNTLEKMEKNAPSPGVAYLLHRTSPQEKYYLLKQYTLMDITETSLHVTSLQYMSALTEITQYARTCLTNMVVT